MTVLNSRVGGVVDPAAAVIVQLENRYRKPFVDFYGAVASVKLTLLEGTQHGKLVPEVDNVGGHSYNYEVDPGYLGNDKAVFMAEFGGKRYKVVTNFVITPGIDENNPQCPRPELIQVTKPSSGANIYDLNNFQEKRGPGKKGTDLFSSAQHNPLAC